MDAKETLRRAWEEGVNMKKGKRDCELDHGQVIHIIKKLFHVPTHLAFEDEIRIDIGILQAMGIGGITAEAIKGMRGAGK